MCVFQMLQWPKACSTRSGLLAVLGAFFLATGSVRAADTASFDFPITDSTAIPSRLAGPVKQIVSSDRIGYTIFALQPANPGEEVLVTVVFEDGAEGGPALLWIDDSASRSPFPPTFPTGWREITSAPSPSLSPPRFLVDAL